VQDQNRSKGGPKVPSQSRTRDRKKRIEEVVTYAWRHRTRVLILIVLNEGVYTPAEIAAIIDEPLKNVSNHVKELVEAGSIELAKTQQRRNMTQHYYRAVQMPFYSDEAMERMTPEQRDITYGLVIQSMVAEMMAALWKGKLNSDPRTWLSWRWFNVDDQGRNDIADELQRSWDRMWEIEGEATIFPTGVESAGAGTGLLPKLTPLTAIVLLRRVGRASTSVKRRRNDRAWTGAAQRPANSRAKPPASVSVSRTLRHRSRPVPGRHRLGQRPRADV
jgi:DNA-binding transcriptional ArsR family regulator